MIAVNLRAALFEVVFLYWKMNESSKRILQTLLEQVVTIWNLSKWKLFDQPFLWCQCRTFKYTRQLKKQTHLEMISFYDLFKRCSLKSLMCWRLDLQLIALLRGGGVINTLTPIQSGCTIKNRELFGRVCIWERAFENHSLSLLIPWLS